MPVSDARLRFAESREVSPRALCVAEDLLVLAHAAVARGHSLLLRRVAVEAQPLGTIGARRIEHEDALVTAFRACVYHIIHTGHIY